MTLAKNHYKVHRTLHWDVHDSVSWYEWFRSWLAQLQQYRSNLHSILFFFLTAIFILSACLLYQVIELSLFLIFCFFTVVLNEENSGMFCCDLLLHCIRVKSSSVYICICIYAIFFLSSILLWWNGLQGSNFACVSIILDFLNFPNSYSSEVLSLPTQRLPIKLIWIKVVIWKWIA